MQSVPDPVSEPSSQEGTVRRKASHAHIDLPDADGSNKI